jgi:hypothetical protein
MVTIEDDVSSDADAGNHVTANGNTPHRDIEAETEIKTKLSELTASQERETQLMNDAASSEEYDKADEHHRNIAKLLTEMDQLKLQLNHTT